MYEYSTRIADNVLTQRYEMVEGMEEIGKIQTIQLLMFSLGYMF